MWKKLLNFKNIIKNYKQLRKHYMKLNSYDTDSVENFDIFSAYYYVLEYIEKNLEEENVNKLEELPEYILELRDGSHNVRNWLLEAIYKDLSKSISEINDI